MMSLLSRFFPRGPIDVGDRLLPLPVVGSVPYLAGWQWFHTPGHTEGSVCLYEERHALLLSGDVLFAGSYGRTDLPGGDDDQMVASLARLAREIPEAVRVLPGHGPETTIGRELPWLRRIAGAGRLLIPG